MTEKTTRHIRVINLFLEPAFCFWLKTVRNKGTGKQHLTLLAAILFFGPRKNSVN